MKEAEQFAAEDAKKKDEAETRNHADHMVYQSEKTLADMGDKIDANDKQSIETALQKVRTALTGTDTDAIKSAVDELEKTFYAVSEKLYSQAAPQDAPPFTGGDAGSGPDTAGGGHEGQVYDADYEVVDDGE
jgi:molecular chaperone DnaK